MTYAATFSPELTSSVDFMYKNQMTVADNVTDYGPYEYVSRAAAAKFYAYFAINVLGKKEDESLSCSFGDIKKVVKDVRELIVKSCRL